MAQTSQQRKARRDERDMIAEVASALEDRPDSQIACRGLRHAWPERPQRTRLITPKTKREKPILRLDFPCTRGCDVIRHDQFIVRNTDRPERLEVVERLPSHYTHPVGYLLSGMGLPPGSARSVLVWQEYLRRLSRNVTFETQLIDSENGSGDHRA